MVDVTAGTAAWVELDACWVVVGVESLVIVADLLGST